MAKVENIFVTAVYVADEHALDPIGRTAKLIDTLKDKYANYEVLLIDNGISSTELEGMREILKNVPCIRVIRLSKSTDTDTAIFAGVEASIGDFICVLYDNDPIEKVPDFITAARTSDIVFGVAKNLVRRSKGEQLGANAFYWYSNRYLKIGVPRNSTYFICLSRSVANALTRSGRFMRHIRHMAQRVGFKASVLEYELPEEAIPYSKARRSSSLFRAIDLISNYSSHPLRALSYFGLIAGLLNVLYAFYVVIVNLSGSDVEKGWTTLSLQSSLMFFMLFMILAVLAEYIGKILNETQMEPPYHIKEELSSTISIADETRRNVTK